MPAPIPPDADPGPDRPASATALAAARLRAVHLLVDDPPPILDDPVSGRLLDPAAIRTIGEDPERWASPSARALRTEVVARSRYAEDRLAEAVRRGVRQYIILGAGLDTFAYRQPRWAARLRILEVDHPASQRDKLARLRRAGILTPPNVRFVAADLEATDLGDRLAAAGLTMGRPVFVACLGVLIYLGESALDVIGSAVAGLAGGSELVITFSRPDPTAASAPAPGSPAARVEAAGEPWRTRLEPDAVTRRLTRAGFRSVFMLFDADITERYLQGRTDGLRAPARAAIADAMV